MRTYVCVEHEGENKKKCTRSSREIHRARNAESIRDGRLREQISKDESDPLVDVGYLREGRKKILSKLMRGERIRVTSLSCYIHNNNLTFLDMLFRKT